VLTEVYEMMSHELAYGGGDVGGNILFSYKIPNLSSSCFLLSILGDALSYNHAHEDGTRMFQFSSCPSEIFLSA
jgi:hypothetical protein